MVERRSIGPKELGPKVKKITIELEGDMGDAKRSNNLRFSYDNDTGRLIINSPAWGDINQRFVGGIYNQITGLIDIGREKLTEAEISKMEAALKKFLK